MKSIFILIMTLIFAFTLQAQPPFPTEEDPNTIAGGLGVTWIDGVSYTTFSVTPDLSFGKFGVGLRIELLFDNQDNFKFRKIGWEDGAGIARIIRYLRYGHKDDPVYARLGSLVSATLGHGFIMWHYSNEASYDARKIGLSLDLDFDSFGMESVISDLGNFNIYGGRLYYRPLSSTDIPILGNLEIGATAVTDRNPDSNKETDDDITEWGMDIGLPLINLDIFKTILYFDYAKLVHFGEGKVIGVNFGFPDVVGLFSLDARLERRWLGDKFLPNYFNTLYELQRSLPQGLDKKSILELSPKSKGVFGELAGNIAGVVRLIGSYQHQDGVSHSGLFHLEARLFDVVPGIRLLAYYDKTNVETFKDLRTLDIYSQAIAELGYMAYGFLMVSMRYRWNFIKTEDGSYVPQERFEPRLSLNFDL